MKRFLAMSFMAAALIFGAVQLLSPAVQAAGGGGCPAGQVRCLACNGGPGICARSYAFCPECPAP